jgi:two-component system LytT family response regulator
VSWIEVREIEWIEAADYYVQVHAQGKAYLVRESLQKLEQRLGEPFLRVHRSALVNVAKVQRLERLEGGELGIVLQSGSKVPVSRARRRRVSRRLIRRPG